MKLNFDTTKVTPAMGLSIIPAGIYPVAVDQIEQRDNAESDGQHLAVRLEVTDGKYKGRKIFQNLNLWNESESAVEYANGAFATLCQAVGVASADGELDTDDIVGVELRADVRVGKKDATYGKSNFINKYMPLEGSADEADDADMF